ncbi:hypothetical protein WJX73_003193 [Symbiochloris irregularis]|uniref:Uncharacterized protein n=1 Tax=Symbiochloris irregularis TaxID=706552 RepID=A0AAW1NID4_9CHLO
MPLLHTPLRRPQGLIAAHAPPKLYQRPLQHLYRRKCSAARGSKQAEYNKTMQREMKWDHLNPYEYHPERGLYYHEILPNLLSSCIRQGTTSSTIGAARRKTLILIP